MKRWPSNEEAARGVVVKKKKNRNETKKRSIISAVVSINGERVHKNLSRESILPSTRAFLMLYVLFPRRRKTAQRNNRIIAGRSRDKYALWIPRRSEFHKTFTFRGTEACVFVRAPSIAQRTIILPFLMAGHRISEQCRNLLKRYDGIRVETSFFFFYIYL